MERVLAAVQSQPFDLVLMDVFLPRLDGLDATAALKAASDTRDIPVILVSAHQGLAEKVRALAESLLAPERETIALVAPDCAIPDELRARAAATRLQKNAWTSRTTLRTIMLIVRCRKGA